MGCCQSTCCDSGVESQNKVTKRVIVISPVASLITFELLSNNNSKSQATGASNASTRSRCGSHENIPRNISISSQGSEGRFEGVVPQRTASSQYGENLVELTATNSGISS